MTSRGNISDNEEPSDEDIEAFGDDADTDVVECPHCGREVYDDADRCGHCGMNVAPTQHSWPVWVILAAIVAAAAVLLACIF